MNLKYIIIILIFPLICIGQNQEKIDSLKALIKTSKKLYKKGLLDSSYKYAKVSYNLAKQLNADSLQVEICGTLSILEPNLTKALAYIEESEQFAIKNNQWKHLKNIYYTRGALYYRKNMNGSALEHFLRLDSLLEIKQRDKFLTAMTKVKIIEILYESRSVNDTSYFPQLNKNINDGLKLVEDGLKIEKDSLDFYNANFLNVPAAIFYEYQAYLDTERNHPQKAIANYQIALTYTVHSDTIFKENHLRKSLIYNGLANLYNKNNQLDSALYYFKKELKAINKSTDTLKMAITHYNIAKFYNTNKKPEKALEHLNTSQELMDNAYFVREENEYDIQEIFASVYFNLGKFDKAFEASEKARHHLMSIQTEFNKKNISELETKYQTSKKEQEIKLLKSQNEIIEEQKKNERYILLGSICILSIIGFALYFLFRNRQKTNTKLKELDTLKSNFFANISHEFRTPLTLINSPIDDILTEDSISNQKRQQFTIAKQNSERLLKLVNQVLDLSKIDEGQLKLKLQQGNVLQLILALSEAFTYQALQKNISYILNINHSIEEVWFDKDAIEKIAINLLSNAIKYTPENGFITTEAYIEKNRLFLKVKNSGRGLTAFELDNIFGRFYQTNEQNQGSGIGLALVKELVELHKGKIEVHSIPNKETLFSLSLSVDENNFKNNTILVKSNNEITTETHLHSDPKIEDDEVFTNSDLPILLIVEDNEDLRHLIKHIFKDNYSIITAPNGKIGVELALEHIPDLIISDIMMPIKDGIALTKDIKNDERSSHIPIILLTAKAEVESQFSGIDSGADDYITKPFDKKLLALKVEKLIASRKQLQLRYSQELVLLPKDISITNLDEQFLEKVQTTLDKNLIEPSFNVTEFSEAVGMSRMQLHRKLKALTGFTASEFIRSQRLKLAAQFLKTSDINISQVGYSVGFNDHSYFTKCFKDFYKCTPTEYTKRK
ncbi:response regulator [Winogradskyella sp. PG-2]|uniref:response regulator n=1 Tax=Winogradskyella sp. PG-2 TaxID=754409 RepID=UPI0004587BB6|nr:response regulator [Winogradskyella sp. PG-2]BAO74535.1 DNA-binding response regulator, AraC family [Winogradskyella sp. PG-2]